MNKGATGILLLNFGSPHTPEEIEPFLSHILKGKKVPGEMLDKITERYSSIGGSSPLLSITTSQAAGLREELKGQGKDYPVYMGMLHGKPFIKDSVRQMAEEGIDHVVAVSLAPFFSKTSTGAYFQAVREAVEAEQQGIGVSFGKQWHTHPFFIEAVGEKVTAGLKHFSAPEEVTVIFSAHSLSEDDPEDAGCYQKQFQDSVAAVMARVKHGHVFSAFQSKGMKPGKWLGPQVGEIIEMLASQGEKQVLAVPIGFVSDHMETLYDLDIEAKNKAVSLGMGFQRCPALNDSPFLIKALAATL
ncbi:ferrochelatase [Candidatus Formimonas warabiya]|uniref:Coproporphyrin III ferrochelatase n=1 Tax=Formimonas warabiya TaxID=1761012 RepID=A0A3G1KTE4_FORW1|nr:ferrochelatase [Candidatus Formimonas warabiya]ATW25700.1 ferrochelatase [Candidatus Formimonas warabiya]